MLKTLGIFLGVMAFGFIVFFLGLKVNFPSEAALERVRYLIQEEGDGKWAFEASDASIWLPSGLEFTDATLYKVEKARKKVKRNKKKKGKAEDEEPTEDPAVKASPFLHLDSLSVRAGLFALMRGRTSVIFDADLYGGGLSGTIDIGEKSRRIELDGEDIDLSAVPFAGEDWNLALAGLASVDADFEIDSTNIKESKGYFKLNFEDLAFEGGALMGLEMPPTAFTESFLNMEINQGKAEIKDGHFKSDLVDVGLGGEITLSTRELSRWRVRVTMELKFSEQIDTLARMAPMLNKARDTEGVYHLLCTGTLSSPHCREERAGGTTRNNIEPDELDGEERSAKRRGGKGIPGGLGGPDAGFGPGQLGGAEADDGGGEETMSAEERRQKRLDRIRERRERMRKQREDREAGGGPSNEDGPMGRPDEDFPPPMDINGPIDDGPPGMDEPLDDGPRDFPSDEGEQDLPMDDR